MGFLFALFLFTLLIIGVVGVSLLFIDRRPMKFAGRINSLGSDLTPLQIQAHVQKSSKKMEKHRLPSIHIIPDASTPSSAWQSKFGGLPYWPKAMPYPHTPDNKPLYLLAQFNFQEIPSLPDYPHEGILQFFIATDDLMGLNIPERGEPFVESMTQQERFRVVYHPTTTDDESLLLNTAPTPSDDDIFPLDGEHLLSFEQLDDLPSLTDHRFNKLKIVNASTPEAIIEELHERFDRSSSKLGGYANFAQTDPRHNTNEEWLLLFQMATENREGVNIMWGDDGIGHFFIKREDLISKDFSRVMYHWDCY